MGAHPTKHTTPPLFLIKMIQKEAQDTTPHIVILDTSDNVTLHEGRLITQMLQMSPDISENNALSITTLPIHVDPSLVPHEIHPYVAGIIISGTTDSCMDDSLPYVAPLMQLIRDVHGKGRCVLWGICGGAQIIARALGGNDAVGVMPAAEHGYKEITTLHTDIHDPLHSGLPNPFLSTVCHGDYFDISRLPHNSLHLGRSRQWADHAYRIGEVTWGIQYHPEILTDEAERIFADARKRGHDVTVCDMPNPEIM